MKFGQGTQTLKVSIKTSEEAIVPVWTEKDNTTREWNYGQVPIRSTAPFQIKIHGTIDNAPGYIVLGLYPYKTNDMCRLETSLKPVCSKNITSAPDYIASPYYPSIYVNNIHCSWYINAPVHHVIRLKFLDFMLQDLEYYMFSEDFVQIYDGDERTGTSLGKFYSYIYPEFVQSSSNFMTVIFDSDEYTVRHGFKALVNFAKGL
ncbi:hypothetical protein QZH41_010891 [Actinostola sp. cb2023]|nr:hypothetical protein QZH41_010891 [Actinostola sp. cb2023]